MTVTVYMAENPGAFFVEYMAPRPAPTTPEEEEAQPPSEEEWQDLAGPGGVSPPTQAAGAELPPVIGLQAHRIGYTPYPQVPGLVDAGMMQRQDAVHSPEDLLTLVRETVSALVAVPGPGGIPVGYGGPPTFSSCKESIQITRLDEGYLVIHVVPFRKKELSQAVEVESEGRTKLKVFPDWMLDILKALNTLGRGAGFGPKNPYGFSSVDQVVDFVKTAVSEGAETAA